MDVCGFVYDQKKLQVKEMQNLVERRKGRIRKMSLVKVKKRTVCNEVMHQPAEKLGSREKMQSKRTGLMQQQQRWWQINEHNSGKLRQMAAN